MRWVRPPGRSGRCGCARNARGRSGEIRRCARERGAKRLIASACFSTRDALTAEPLNRVPPKIPARVRWAVEMLAPEPGDDVLEIGCGNGAAIALVAERLDSGTITGIDRSGVMVRRARDLNGRHIASGRARIEQVALEDATFGGRLFDRILAVNVNAFWTAPATTLEAVNRLLAPEGMLCLVYQPPETTTVSHLAREVTRIFCEHGLAQPTVAFTDIDPVPALCLRSRRATAPLRER